MIPRRRLKRWINRRSFATRKGVILQWLVLNHLLTMGYKSTFLSTLIAIRYENTIDTIQDLAESHLPFALPRATFFHKLIATDPRPDMRKIYKRSLTAETDSKAKKRIMNM